MEDKIENQFTKNLIKILKGSLISIILSLILLFIFAILLTFTPLKENIINPVIVVISTISIFVGSSISTLKIKKNGFLNGGFVGIIYILTLYLLSSITCSGFTFNLYTIIMIIASIIAGIIGGIIGVNIK